jgi:3-dehydroquinate synthase
LLLDRLTLSLGYDVVVASGLAGFGAELGRVCPHERALVVSNPTVRALHREALESELGSVGRAVEWFEIPDGERYKTLSTWSALVERLVAARPDRTTPILAFGGGVVGDVAGFAAASCLRGLPVVQVPTTLLAMVDSSVGGKTGVNTAKGKNLVGAFHQPALVWAPIDCLGTLPDAELRCGLGEGLKHAVLRGETALAGWESRVGGIRARDPATLAAVVMESIRMKAEIVEADPTERGRRAVLNLGHTLAHGIEACAGFGEVRHGEAVAIGMVAAARLATETFPEGDSRLAARLSALLTELGLPSRLPSGLATAELVAAMGFDKKRLRGKLRLVLPAAAGDVRLFDAPESAGERLAVLAAAGSGESR